MQVIMLYPMKMTMRSDDAEIFDALVLVSSANLRTLSATTANPLPYSPARAASIAVFKARMLV
jgi:hypothetical protein